MVVIRTEEDILKNYLGMEWESRLNKFSRVIGFSYEKSGEVKIEFNPDRPDLYSVLSLIKSMDIFEGKPNRIGRILRTDRILINHKPQIRPYIAVFEVKIKKENKYISNDAVDYLDKLSESAGKKRKLFAYGVHDLESIRGDLDYENISISEQFETYDGMNSEISHLINEHNKGIQYGKLALIRENDKKICALKDSIGPISIPPLFNSSRTKITSKTTSILVDVTSPSMSGLILGTRLATGYFRKLGRNIEFAGGNDISYVLKNLKNTEYPLQTGKIQEIAGIEVSAMEVKQNLKKMGYSFRSNMIVVPDERIDVMGFEDIAEDFIKAYGLNRINAKELTSNFTGSFEVLNLFTSKAREVSIELGFQEIINFVLRKEDGDSTLDIVNAKSEEYSKLRKDLVGGFLEFYQRNMQYGFPQKIFEVGDVFNRGIQDRVLGISTCGRHANYSEVKGYLDRFLSAFTENRFEIIRDNREEFIEGRSGTIELSGENIGYIGELTPGVISRYTFYFPVTYAELSLSKLLKCIKSKHE